MKEATTRENEMHDTERVECAYCGHMVIESEVPNVSDDEGWSAESEQHHPDCEWVLTRSFQIPDGYTYIPGRGLQEVQA